MLTEASLLIRSRKVPKTLSALSYCETPFANSGEQPKERRLLKAFIENLFHTALVCTRNQALSLLFVFAVSAI